LGIVSESVLALAAVRPVTSVDIALELQLSRSVARQTVSRLHSIGYLKQTAVVKVGGSKKPLRQVVTAQARIPGADPVGAPLNAWVRSIRTVGEV
jgi:hypothetical protein